MSETDQVQDADSTAIFTPVVQLERVEVDSGEKDEKEIWKSRSRLYRYAADKNPAEWVTRGLGQVRFLKHLKNGQIRLLLREAKTLKVRMNHMVQPDAPLKPKAGSEEVCFQWYAKDYAEDEPWEGLFAIKFASTELAQEFKGQYELAQKGNKAAALGGGGGGDAAPTAAPKTSPSPATTQNKAKPVTATPTPARESSVVDEKKESAWRKLNKTFRAHMDKDVKNPATAGADWSTAMSEYLIFAHKLRGDKSPAPSKALSSKKTVFTSLNSAFQKWAAGQKDSSLDADWSPPIRDYLVHAAKMASK